MKQCTGCHRELEEHQFDLDMLRNGKRLLRSRCKACRLAERRQCRKGRPTPPSPLLMDVLDDELFDIEVEGPVPDPYPTVPERFYEPSHSGELLRVLFIPDCHLPFHHQANFDLMLRAAGAFRPDIVVVLGDLHDFYAVNAHGKSPVRNNSLKQEVLEASRYLRQIEQLTEGKLIYIEGNHEDRFRRYVEGRAPDLFGMTSVREILGLDKRWVWVPYTKSYRLGKLHLTHDTGTAGRNAARQAMDVFQGSAVIGHTHRMEMSFMGNADGPPSVGCMFGWLGDPVHADYMHEVQARRNWVQGFGVGYMRPDGVVHLVPCPIVDKAVVIEGRLIT